MRVKLENSDYKETTVYIFSDSGLISSEVADKLSKSNLKIKQIPFYKAKYFIKSFSKKYLKTQEGKIYFLILFENSDKRIYSSEKYLIKQNFELCKKNILNTLYIFPRVQGPRLKKFIDDESLYLFNNLPFSGVLYLGDVISELEPCSSYIDKLVYSVLRSKKIRLSNELKSVYPLSLSDSGEHIVRFLFSINAYNKKALVFGKPYTREEFLEILLNLNGKLKVENYKDTNTYIEATRETKLIDTDLYSLIKKKADNLHLVKSKRLKLKVTQYKLKEKLNMGRPFLTAAAFLFFIFVGPLILLFLSRQAINLSSHYLEAGSYKKTKLAVSLSGSFIKTTDKIFSFYNNISVLPSVYNKLDSEVYLADKKYLLIYNLFDSVDKAINVTENIQKDGSLVSNFLQQLYFNSKEIYRLSSLLEGEGESNFGDDRKNKILQISNILDSRNNLIGVGGEANYLLILNSEKPKLALINIIDGKLERIEYLSLDDIGYKLLLEIPVPGFAKNFEEEVQMSSRLLSYTDYREIAEKAVWLVDKAKDKKITGVVILDNIALSQLLNFGGNISGIEDLFQRIEVSSRSQKADILFKTLKLLDSKHIAMVFSDNNIDGSLSDLNWNGSVNRPACSDNCYSDLIGISEFPALYIPGIKRELNLEISFQEKLIKRKLTLFIENGNNFEFKTYIKLISNKDAGLAPVEISTFDTKEETLPEISSKFNFKESGVLVELGAREAKAVTFHFESSFGNLGGIGSYNLFFRKEPGRDNIPLTARFESPERALNDRSPRVSLTDGGALVYNNDLDKDFSVNINLK